MWQWLTISILNESLRICDFAFGPSPQDWEVLVFLEQEITLFRSTQADRPGSWQPDLVSKIPQVICWEPGDEEKQEAHWVKKESS